MIQCAGICGHVGLIRRGETEPRGWMCGFCPDCARREFLRMRQSLNTADAMAQAIDRAVRHRLIGSRSAIADARLDFGEPDRYEWTPDVVDSEATS